MQNKLTFVCISDTHGLHNEIHLPKGDILIHCGDFTNICRQKEVQDFVDWLKKQPFKHKIVVAGNHDICFDTESYRSHLKNEYHYREQINENELIDMLQNNCHYLMNSSVTIEGYKIWGSPYSLEHWGKGFQLPPEMSHLMWSQIDVNADIVVTHGPSYGHGDLVKGIHVGDLVLFKKIQMIKPKYHLFGHIHQGYGKTTEDGITFINCSLVNQDYLLVNKPQVFTLPRKI